LVYLEGYYEFASNPALYGEKGNPDLAKIAGTAPAPNLEDVAKLKPDLVMGAVGLHDSLRDALKTIAPLYLINASGLAPMQETIRTIGRLTGHSSQAEAAIQKFQSKLNAYKAKSPNNLNILVVAGFGSDFYIYNELNPVCTVLSDLAKCATGKLSAQELNSPAGIVKISVERILEIDPNVIIGIGYAGAPNPITSLKNNAFWKELKAVKNQKVIEGDSRIWASTFFTRGLSAILDEAMTKIYPDVFPKALP
jgi:iron complex transport system substrate-binding protein